MVVSADSPHCVSRSKKLNFKISDSERFEVAIATAVKLATDQFQPVLNEGRSLRKDDVRSRRNQEALLLKVKELSSDT